MKDTVYVPGDGYLDIPRSDSLWGHVFKGPRSVLHTGDWIDQPSVGIPYLYVATGIELAEALKETGNAPKAKEVFDLAKQVAVTVRLDALVRSAEAEFQQARPGGDTAAASAIPLMPAAPPAAKKSEPAPETRKKKTP